MPEHVAVLMVPDRSGSNPYQRLLGASLAALGYRVSFDACRGRGLPLRAAVARDRPDIVHVQFLDSQFVDARISLTLIKFLRLLLELIWVRTSGTRLVITVHNITRHDSPRPRLENALLAVLVRQFHVIIVLCPVARSEVVSAYRLSPRMSRRIRITPQGNYDGEYPSRGAAAEVRRRLGVDENQKLLLCFGAIRGYKGVVEFAEAFCEISDPQLHLMVAGPPSSGVERRLRALAAAHANVHLELERIPDDEVADLFEAADAIVIAHQRILLSGVAVLAMTLGRPIISTREGCQAALLANAGTVWLDSLGVDGVARALQELQEADVTALAEASAREGARLTWAQAARSTAEAYH